MIYAHEYYYYIRDSHNRPIVTVCLLKYANFIVRGVAICSRLDQPCKVKGRQEAFKRAKKAMNIRIEITTTNSPSFVREMISVNGIDNVERSDIIHQLGETVWKYGWTESLALLDYKTYLRPDLTEFEQKLTSGDSSK